MMHRIFCFGLLVLIFTLSGCSSSSHLQRSSLSVNDRIDVLQAEVVNPYPECDPALEYRRVANLSVERAERVYLQGGKLCQRSN